MFHRYIGEGSMIKRFLFVCLFVCFVLFYWASLKFDCDSLLLYHFSKFKLHLHLEILWTELQNITKPLRGLNKNTLVLQSIINVLCCFHPKEWYYWHCQLLMVCIICIFLTFNQYYEPYRCVIRIAHPLILYSFLCLKYLKVTSFFIRFDKLC